MMSEIVILGNGIAGYAAAREIRKYDTKSPITFISEERSTTYLRPLLSKTYFKSFQKEKIRLETDEWYREQGMRQILGTRIIGIRTKEKCVELDHGTVIPYDICIYALGSSCFVPPFGGKDKKGVMVVHSFRDFDQIRRRLYTASNAVVIGGGVIGLEMAWELKQMNCGLTILEAGPRLMGRLLDEQSAGVLSDAIRSQGITVEAGVNIKEITGDEAATGVACADGSWYPADVVIVSCGVRANSQIAREAGLTCDRGVIVDETMRTSDPCIYAAGDCMQAASPNPSLWSYSKVSGETAGYNICHPDTPRPFIAPPSPVIISGFGTNLFSIGDVSIGEGVTIVDGDDCTEKSPEPVQMAGRRFRVNEARGGDTHYSRRIYRDGKLKGAVLLGDLSDMAAIKAELGF
ncbi:MAG: FAD-dependent oxidoreductase [Clostridiales bacterium]|nr:FAD-dependent oxidoreductase [Clostridiales bacterium]